MKKYLLVLLLCGVSFATVFGNSVREFTVQAVEYTVASKIKSKTLNVTEMYPVPSMVLLKDGKQHRISFENSPGVWINSIYRDDLGPGEFDWTSETRDAPPPGGVVIHRSYCQIYELLAPMERMIEPARLKQGAYSQSNGNYRGIPCYKITVRYPANDKTISQTSLYDFHPNIGYRLTNDNPDSVGKQHCLNPELYYRNHDQLRPNYFAGIQLLIDKTPGRPFIYEMKAFNRNGKLIYEMNWGDVEFLTRIDPSEFELPGREIVKVANHREFSKENRIAFGTLYHKNDKREPSRITRAFNSIWAGAENNAGNILNWGGKIAFWLAIAAALLAVLLKIRSKVRNQ